MSKAWFDARIQRTSGGFETWWVAFYGKPEAYENNRDEQDEYWVRKAFAWHGWCGRNAQLVKACEQLSPKLAEQGRFMDKMILDAILPMSETKSERPL